MFRIEPRTQNGRFVAYPLVMAALGLAAAGGCQMAADGHNLDGVRLYQQGNFNTALQRFQQALANNPANADAYYNMAATMHRMGQQKQDQEALQQAETLYNQCLDLDENHLDCHRGLAVLLVETERPDRALALLKNWALASPESAEARVELARLYDEFGDRDTAKVHLNEALSIDQHNHRAWAALGRIRDEEGAYDQALANYQRSYNLNRFQPAIAERIATLNRSTRGDLGVTDSGGTRTVSHGLTRY